MYKLKITKNIICFVSVLIFQFFQVLGEVNECVKTGLWVGDCFIYTNAVNRINYYVGGETVTIAHLDHTMYLLGYVPKENRLILLSVHFLILISVFVYLYVFLFSGCMSVIKS